MRILSIDTTWDRATGRTKHTGYTLLPGAALDISALTTTDGERGLLGIAFSSDGRTLYVDHTATNGDIQVASYTIEDKRAFSGGDGVKAPQADTVVGIDPASRQTLLTIPHQQASNHNGGQLVLGPDGYLYVGVGDGGGAGDTAGNAQNTDTLLGKILRIDPAGAALGSLYAIPADNPFAGGGGRPEIYLYGVRNPWRFSFDSANGDLWVGRRRPGRGRGDRLAAGQLRRRPGRQPGLELVRGRHAPSAPTAPRPRARSARSTPTPTTPAAARSPAATSTAAPRCPRSPAPTSTATTAPVRCGACSPARASCSTTSPSAPP